MNDFFPHLSSITHGRKVCNHNEAYVRKAVLFAASCLLSSLHPTYVANSLSEGNLDVSEGLEWVRMWAIHVAETDTDRECYTVISPEFSFSFFNLLVHGVTQLIIYLCIIVNLRV